MTDLNRIIEDMIQAVDEDVYREALADRGVPWDETMAMYEADIESLWHLQRLIEKARVGGARQAGQLLDRLLSKSDD